MIAALLLAAAIAVAGPGPRHTAAAGPSMLVSPSPATGSIGADVPIDIDAADIGAPGLGGYVIALAWNPAILSLTSLVDSGWVTGGSIVVICTTATIDNTLGKAEIDCTPAFAFGPGVTTTAPMALANATFHALSSGTTTIDLTGSSLLDPSDVAVPGVTLTNGTVNVSSGQSVGGIANMPDVAALSTRDGDSRRGQAGFGAAIVAALSAAGAAMWLWARRRGHTGNGDRSG